MSPAVVWVQNATYGPGGEMDSMQYRTSSGSYYTENRAYNNRAQLTSLQASASGLTGINLQYGFPAAPGNAGRISQTTNVASGEQIVYSYDSLNRLIQAQTSSNSWGQSFTYDGFGNLTGKAATAGSAPYMSLAVDPTTNHITTAGLQYDGNGNLTNLPNVSGTLSYDIENRTGSGNVLDYDLENQPLYRDGQWNLYGLHGERLATYTFNWVGWSNCDPNPCTQGYDDQTAIYSFNQTSRNIYFAGRLIQSNNTTVLTDGTGSVRANESGQTLEYYPFGEEMGTATANGREKFATYTREAGTGLDYADQRYFTSTYGAFLTPDRLHTTAISPADPNNPGSWNRYSYVGGDPVNNNDPSGTDCASAFADASQPYDPYSPCSGGSSGGTVNPCAGFDPNFLMALEESPQAPTFEAQAAAMGCGDASAGEQDEQHVTAPLPSCSLSLYERYAGGSPGNHTYLDVSETLGGVTMINEVMEGDPATKAHPPFRNPFSGAWPPLKGYIEPVYVGAPYQGSTNPASNTLEETDTGANICTDIPILENAIGSYNKGPLARYMAVPRAGFYNSNSFTYTLLFDVGLVNPNGSDVFAEPSGWNPGWGKLVPGLHP